MSHVIRRRIRAGDLAKFSPTTRDVVLFARIVRNPRASPLMSLDGWHVNFGLSRREIGAFFAIT